MISLFNISGARMSSIDPTGRLGTHNLHAAPVDRNDAPAGVKPFSRERKEEPSSVDAMPRNGRSPSRNGARRVAAYYAQAADPHPNPAGMPSNPSPHRLAVPTGNPPPPLHRANGFGGLTGAQGVAAYYAQHGQASQLHPVVASDNPPSYSQAIQPDVPPLFPPMYHQVVRPITPPAYQE
jgi:hypothetical protein